MIKTIIVDDEPSAIKVLKLMIGQHCPELQIVATSDNISDAYQQIISLNPNLIFLDINMPKGNGLELLERIQHQSLKTVLTTAYQQFAIEALRLSALDYLLKPIGKEELRSAVDRYNSKDESTSKVVGNFDNHNPRISIKTVDGLTILNLQDIQFIESFRNYSIFHNGVEEIVSSKSLGEYETFLEGLGFVRIHRSTIVQVSQIKKLRRGKNWSVKLISNRELEVSRKNQEELNRALEKSL
ncbi:LytR/AlgR family response regulator transcription factor [Ekhidna sp.]